VKRQGNNDNKKLLSNLLQEEPGGHYQNQKGNKTARHFNTNVIGLLLTAIGVLATIIVVPEVRSLIGLDKPSPPRIEESLSYLFYPSCTFLSEETINLEVVDSLSDMSGLAWSVFRAENINAISSNGGLLIPSVAQFILTTPRDIVITDVELRIEAYSSPPTNYDNLEVTIINGCPMGSGPLPGIDLGTPIVTPNVASYKLRAFEDAYFQDSYLPYKLDAGDAVMFNPFIKFTAFGHYQLRFSLEVIDVNSTSHNPLFITSPLIDYKTIPVSSDRLQTLPSREYTPK